MTAEGTFCIRENYPDGSYVTVRNSFGKVKVFTAATIEAELERLNALTGRTYTPAIWRD